MNFKLAFTVLIVLSLMAPAFAGNVDYFNETTKINFEGMEFMIPTGFGESRDAEDFNDLGSDGQTCFYINEAKGEIIITVVSDWMGMSLEELYQDGAVKTTINGHEGWNYTNKNLTCFGYVDNDTGVIVAVTNETRLKEVIL